MDNHTRAGILKNGGIFRDRVISFHLEAPPIRPNSGADAVVAQQVSNLVAFYRMVERRYLIAKLLGHIENERHFVGAVAVVLDRDVTIQYASKRFKPQIACIFFATIALFLILLRLDPCLPVHGDVAHAR